MKRVVALLLAGVACGAAAGCGGRSDAKQPPAAVQRAVAGRFARALLRGDATTATALLAHADDPALSSLVIRAAARWRLHHGALRPAGTRAGDWWSFEYTATRTQADGSFERLRGEIVVLVGPARRGAGVELFALPNLRVRFSTHHDSVLLPSNR